ncbi:hypothetical protein DL546_008214 [Coniochaeta pulveracea]|uniref:Uncharacterized protein n=1 Tax=Coniochaeta pulveracea TaxID=177199 RepID=A0A420YNV8_9PEZI|nr:hypothetical protein DL546_008214 [Coniochaeta pulveracea]
MTSHRERDARLRTSARSEREAELERRIASLTTEVRQIQKAMLGFQQKVTSLDDSGYGSGSAIKKHTSSAASGSDESSSESSSDSEELEYTSSPPIMGPPSVAVPAISKPRPNAHPSGPNRVTRQARSISGATNARPNQAAVSTASNSSARPVRVASVSAPRSQQAPKLARVTGGFPIKHEYSSSPKVLERDPAARSAVPKVPVAVSKSESKPEDDESDSNSEGSESSSNMSSSDEDSFESDSEDE